MGRPRCFAVGLAASLCAIASIGATPERHTDAQEHVPPWKHQTPQRMCVGMVKEGKVVGFERTRRTSEIDGEDYISRDWYQGSLGSGGISLWDVQTSVMAGRESAMLRRWYCEEGRLWLAFESLYGSVGPNSASLLRTKPPAAVDALAPALDQPDDAEPHPDRKVVTETCIPDSGPFSAVEQVERLSQLRPLMGSVDPIRTEWNHDRDLGLFGHRIGGFDFIPHGLDHWTLILSVRYTMQIWDCRSKRVATEKGEGFRNVWTLVTEFWVPWTGQFFVFEPERYEYVVVRDCGEVYELRLDYDERANTLKSDQGTIWHGRQLLDPVDYLIALVYIEPENTVYGFGPNFYVRLVTGERRRPLEPAPSSHTKKSCRDVTKGKAIWTDEKGQTHELGEPFRTIWQCANVLKEDGVLQAATETETRAEGP